MQQLPPPPKRSLFVSSAIDWARGHKIISGLVALVLVVTVINAVAPPTEAEPPDDRTQASIASPTDSPEPSVEPEIVIPTTKMPAVRGILVQKARQRIVGSDLQVEVVRKFSNRAAGTVLSQSVTAGDRVEEGTTVTLIVAKPLPRVPTLEGMKGKVAKNRLGSAGYDVVIRRQESSSVSPGTVISTVPAAGAHVRPGRTITLIVAKAPPPPPPSTPSCHPSYAGACLDPSASDYDCAGGSGDGPKYTGYVTVVGPDVYDLDSDGDGAGCES